MFLAESCRRTSSIHANDKASAVSLLQNIIEAKILHDFKQDSAFIYKAEKKNQSDSSKN